MDWHVESRPSIVKLAHVKEVGAREATHGGESIAEVLSQSADNLVPPLRGDLEASVGLVVRLGLGLVRERGWVFVSAWGFWCWVFWRP